MRTRLWRLLGILALASSLPCSGQVLKGSRPAEEKPPTPNRLLLPSSGFSGGILTGVVIGPDNNPVPNAPVTINGGVLMGEVIGDSIKKNDQTSGPDDKKQRFRSGGPWIQPGGDTSFGPEYGRPGSFTDWQRSAIDFCKAGPAAAQANPGPPDKPSFQWGDGHSAGGTAASPQWGGLTNAAGGFIICVAPNAENVQVKFVPGVSSEPPVVDTQPAPVSVPVRPPGTKQGLYDPPFYDPPFFCSPGQRFDLNGAFPHASYEQDGKAGEMPVAMALNTDGKTALTTVECSNNLHPGPAKLSITDGTSHVRDYQTHVFQFINGALDQTQLMGGQPADFWYEVQMGPEEAGKSLCVAVTVAGPVVLTKPPEQKVTVNGDGRARVSGKIRATHVAPGSTIPFVIHPTFSECGK